jgi:hypothetical protein
LFAFSRQAIGEQGQIGFALALHASQMVLQYSFGVYQQTANESALAIVNRPACDEFECVGH